MKNHIKTIAASTLTLIFVFTGTLNAQNRPVKAHPIKNRPESLHGQHQSMMQAQKVLKRTHFVILQAKQAVNKSKNYTGDLARAVAHQKQAKKMFVMKNPHKAVLHSKRARMYAFKALRFNKAIDDVDQSYQFNKEENANITAEDDAINLDKELQQTTFDDKAISDKEMTELEVLETKPEDYKNEK